MTDERIAELWAYAYDGEVVGIHLFRLLADSPCGAAHRPSLATAVRLEETTRAMLRPVVEERGLAMKNDEEGTAIAAAIVARYGADDWHTFCSDLIAFGAEAQAQFEELQALVGPVDSELTRELVEHEVAVIEYARASAGGDEEAAEAHLQDHLARHGRSLQG